MDECNDSRLLGACDLAQAASDAGAADTGAASYGWLGSSERAVLDSGLILMGARLYNAVTGRFLSSDPVAGGNEIAYNYPNDPVNRFDTTGLFDWMLALDIGLTVLSFVPGLGVAAMAAKVVITVVKVVRLVSAANKMVKAAVTTGRAVKAVKSMKATQLETKIAGKIFTGRGASKVNVVDPKTGIASGKKGLKSVDGTKAWRPAAYKPRQSNVVSNFTYAHNGVHRKATHTYSNLHVTVKRRW